MIKNIINKCRNKLIKDHKLTIVYEMDRMINDCLNFSDIAKETVIDNLELKDKFSITQSDLKNNTKKFLKVISNMEYKKGNTFHMELTLALKLNIVKIMFEPIEIKEKLLTGDLYFHLSEDLCKGYVYFMGEYDNQSVNTMLISIDFLECTFSNLLKTEINRLNNTIDIYKSFNTTLKENKINIDKYETQKEILNELFNYYTNSVIHALGYNCDFGL